MFRLRPVTGSVQ